jgi:TP901 family phage tail tape measure protein
VAKNSINLLVGSSFDAKGINQAKRQLAALEKQVAPVGSAFTAMGAKMSAIGAGMARTGKAMTVGLTLPIVGVGIAATKMAMDFDTSLTKMVSLVGLTNDEVDGMRDKIKSLASQYGKSASEAADAMFFITSAGLRGSDAMETLEASLKGAAIGLGDVQTIADLATSAMNAYGPSVLSAGKATSILRTAVEQGKLESADLAAAMGSVLPIASALGVGFDEAAAAMASMSRTGTGAAEASTQLRGILMQVTKESPRGAKALKSVGLSYDGIRKTISEDGLLAGLQTLVGAFDGNTIATAKFFGNARALTGVMDLMGAGAATTESIFSELAKTTASDLDPAFAAASETTGFKLSQAMATLKNSLIGVGDAIAPTVEKVSAFVTKIAEAFASLSPKTQNLIVAFAAVAAALGPILLIAGKVIGALGAISSAIGSMSAAASLAAPAGAGLAAGFAAIIAPVALVVGAIALFIGAVVLAYNKSEFFRNALTQFVDQVKATGSAIFGSLISAFNSLTQTGSIVTTYFTILGNYLGGVFGVTLKVIGGIVKAVEMNFKIMAKGVEIAATILTMLANIIVGAVKIGFNFLAGAISGILDKLGPLGAAFKSLATGVKNAFLSIPKFISTAFNGVIKFFENFVNGAIGLVNKLIDAYNAIPWTATISRINELSFAVGGANDSIGKLPDHLSSAGRGMELAGQTVDGWNTSLTGASKATGQASIAAAEFADGLGKVGGGGGGAAEKATKSLKELRGEFKETFTAAMNEQIAAAGETLKTAFDKATTAYNDFKTSITGSGAFGLDFSGAAESAQDGGGTIVGALVGQADGIGAFGTQMNALLQTNLSEDAFAAVVGMGRERGAQLASELLGANGEQLIAQLNATIDNVKAVAEAVGIGAADKWKAAGVKSAQDTYEGFRDNFGAGGPARKALMNLMNGLAESMKRSTTITVTTINRQINESIGAALPGRALGGPVSASNAYLVGEKGPEVFVPNNSGNIISNDALSMTGRSGSMSSSSGANAGNTYSITINTGIGDPRVIGEEVVNVISKFEKANGAVFARA